MPSYKLTNEAREDIRSISRYTLENWGLQQAEHYINALYDRFDILANGDPAAQNADYIRRGLFKRTINKHVILFVKPKDGDIEILRILHQSMDVDRHL